jgi:hypothetical protein
MYTVQREIYSSLELDPLHNYHPLREPIFTMKCFSLKRRFPSAPFFALASFITPITAQLTPNGKCDDICSPMHKLAGACCYTMGMGMSSAMQDCICKNTSFNVSGIAALCDSCLDENGRVSAGMMGNGMMSNMVLWSGKLMSFFSFARP